MCIRDRISEDVVRANWNTATASAPVAAYAVVPSWIEDFRDDTEAVRAAADARVAQAEASRPVVIEAAPAPAPAPTGPAVVTTTTPQP